MENSLERDFLQSFQRRHLGVTIQDAEKMLSTISVSSLDQLINEIIPSQIRLTESLKLPDAVTEYEYLQDIKNKAQKNKNYRSFIGLGYHSTITPSVIQRNFFENPSWYTQYTPYQAEISQGRLELLFYFQTMIVDITHMEVANASLLDEGTAAAEAMSMFFRISNRRKKDCNKFLVSKDIFPQTLEIMLTRAEPLGIEVVIDEPDNFQFSDDTFAIFLQYPTGTGAIEDYSIVIKEAQQRGIFVIMASDILSLTILKPAGLYNADAVVGTTQRFGVPLGYGGPHAAFFATKKEYIREIPGRIVGLSYDRQKKTVYRMALQTREQHIKRDKATSNICTAQALLAVMACLYAIYHGPRGLIQIAKDIHSKTLLLNRKLKQIGYQQKNNDFFDTLKIVDDKEKIKNLKDKAQTSKINFYYPNENTLCISLNETTRIEDLNVILSVFDNKKTLVCTQQEIDIILDNDEVNFNKNFKRSEEFLTHSIFNMYHSETEMMRFLKRLENKELSLVHSMIPLGSCTMKLNSSTEMAAISLPRFSSLHPFVPVNQAQGYMEVIKEMEEMLAEITGFDGVSLQPNSGAQGEFSGLLAIRSYHRDNQQEMRNTVFIPSSAHGTNPASAVMAGMKVVIIRCDDNGNIDLDDLEHKTQQYKDILSALMVTYPSTHGVYEEEIQKICQIIHDNGGLVYMDGANMNAQIGYTNPARIGADVCHLNLHKTFSIPHGGGGPGMGPICVTKKLIPYLPTHNFVSSVSDKSTTKISATPWGSASILLISYAYLKLLGRKGVTQATAYALLNANYIHARLKEYYMPLYTGKNERVAHEVIFDMRPLKKSANIDVEDIAKRLMDYGFHSPTISFPVAGTLMIEPTESEAKQEIDKFCDAMISIRKEIQDIEDGEADKKKQFAQKCTSPYRVFYC